MKIVVEWNTEKPYGVTVFDYDELSCVDKKEWDSLGIPEQRKRLQTRIAEKKLFCSFVRWQEVD